MNHAIYSTTHALDRFSSGSRMESVCLAESPATRSLPERAIHRPIDGAHGCDDGGEGWPGQSAGVRPPYAYETMLSAAEVAHALKFNLLELT